MGGMRSNHYATSLIVNISGMNECKRLHVNVKLSLVADVFTVPRASIALCTGGPKAPAHCTC